MPVHILLAMSLSPSFSRKPTGSSAIFYGMDARMPALAPVLLAGHEFAVRSTLVGSESVIYTALAFLFGCAGFGCMPLTALGLGHIFSRLRTLRPCGSFALRRLGLSAMVLLAASGLTTGFRVALSLSSPQALQPLSRAGAVARALSPRACTIACGSATSTATSVRLLLLSILTSGAVCRPSSFPRSPTPSLGAGQRTEPTPLPLATTPYSPALRLPSIGVSSGNLGPPLSVKFFLYLVSVNRCWMVDRLERRGLPHEPACVLCSHNDETLHHLLIGCVFSHIIWHVIFSWCCPAIPVPDGTLDFLSWLSSALDTIAMEQRRGLSTIAALTAWSL
uniref:Reverse transcriptase zinc-binding domain-containing protein n=1 Tax=Aegilops tauschii subsp. strangulata TaxID=200361 RepID=A0A453JIB6_AEGTS